MTKIMKRLMDFFQMVTITIIDVTNISKLVNVKTNKYGD